MALLDYVIIALYAALILAIGIRAGRGHQSTNELWLGGRRLPTWAVLFSMVATELSAAIFIGVPEAAYRGNWSYLEFAFGALAGKFLLAVAVIPLYHRTGVITVYGLLEQRFGARSRRAAALAFVAGRVLASNLCERESRHRRSGKAHGFAVEFPPNPSLGRIVLSTIGGASWIRSAIPWSALR